MIVAYEPTTKAFFYLDINIPKLNCKWLQNPLGFVNEVREVQ